MAAGRERKTGHRGEKHGSDEENVELGDKADLSAFQKIFQLLGQDYKIEQIFLEYFYQI